MTCMTDGWRRGRDRVVVVVDELLWCKFVWFTFFLR